jgi:hypothetical protein
MSLDPQFPLDPSLWPRSRGPAQITVHPLSPANASGDDSNRSDGPDDWVVPGQTHAIDPYPDDWIVPTKTSGGDSYPDDWIVPGQARAIGPFPDERVVPTMTPAGGSDPDDWFVPRQTPAVDYRSGAFMQATPSTSALPVSYRAPTKPWWNPPGAPGSVFDPWADQFIKGIQGLLNFYSRYRQGGGDPDAPGCKEEWEAARKFCADVLSRPNPPRGFTGGYRNVEDCARGHVSERCGGNPIAR